MQPPSCLLIENWLYIWLDKSKFTIFHELFYVPASNQLNESIDTKWSSIHFNYSPLTSGFTSKISHFYNQFR